MESNFLEHVKANWKTSAGGLLTVVTIFGGVMMANAGWAATFDLSVKSAAWITTIFGTAKVVLGLLQKDAK